MKAVRELKSGVGVSAAPAAGERVETRVERERPAAASRQPEAKREPPAVTLEPRAAAPEPRAASHEPPAMSRSAILEDPKLNSVLSSLPGAIVTDIKEKRK